jgi:hypothetical protein
MASWFLKGSMVLVAVVAACNQSSGLEDTSFDPADIAGVYDLHQVDGHDLGWYHDLAAVDCQVAFVDGQLELDTDSRFLLSLDYDYRCVDANPVDGSSRLGVQGTILRRSGNTYYLGGLGPGYHPIGVGIDNWTLSLTPDGAFVTLRFTGAYGSYFADPIITLGPRRN